MSKATVKKKRHCNSRRENSQTNSQRVLNFITQIGDRAKLTPLQYQIRWSGHSLSNFMVLDPHPSPHRTMKEALASHIRGAFYGLAVADALGAPVEFKARGTFPLVDSMLPNENFRIPDPEHPESGRDVPVPAGSFTDDTSMALCLAESLMDCNGEHDSVDQVRKYLRWMREGYMSSVGECFDVGAATSSALKQWGGLLKEYDLRKEGSQAAEQMRVEMEEQVCRRLDREDRCGNGSLMRVLPVALLGGSVEERCSLAERSSVCTHPHKRCKDACALYVRVVGWALEGLEKGKLAVRLGEIVEKGTGQGRGIDEVLRERLREHMTIADWKRKHVDDIRSTGYVVDSLEASLWAFFSTDSFSDGAIKVVNLGDDADTVGSIYGGLAGAYYGDQAIPKEWLQQMRGMEMVDGVVTRLLNHRTRV